MWRTWSPGEPCKKDDGLAAKTGKVDRIMETNLGRGLLSLLPPPSPSPLQTSFNFNTFSILELVYLIQVKHISTIQGGAFIYNLSLARAHYSMLKRAAVVQYTGPKLPALVWTQF